VGTICVRCGAALAEGQIFCTLCGTRRNELVAAESAQRYCVSCGGQLAPGATFCTKCGSRVVYAGAAIPAIPAPAPSPPHVPTTPSATSAAPAPAAQKSSGAKLLIAALALVAFFACAAIATVVFIGYRAKKKVDEVRQATKQNDAAALLKAITGKSEPNADPGNRSDQGGAADDTVKNLTGDMAEALARKVLGGGGPAEVPKLPEWKVAPADLASSPDSRVPLRASLRLVIAGTEPARGDYESIFIVDSANDQQIHIAAAQQFPNPPDRGRLQAQQSDNDPRAGSKARKINCSQIEFRDALENSAESSPYFCMQGRTDKFPGTTSLSLSRKTLMALKSKGETPFTAYENPMNAFFKSFRDLVSGSGDSSAFLNRVIGVAPGNAPPPTPPIHYTLHRVGPDVALPVLVNDQQVSLPAVHAACLRSDGSNDGDVYVLDDPENPLILAAQTKPNGTGQIIKIYWNSDLPRPVNAVERQLQKEGRAKIYGIYFDFGSSTLRAESKPVLLEIVETMRAHPDWKLRIEGHTDNMGGDSFNQALSNSRADAVKVELTSQYGVASDRLTTEGFGASRPVDTNATIEGRALNRRVELVRQ
jgi:outer membrane protein OmpA-like peptidoglycan-associated protein/predicted  nucleic acid-binding Zn-ribbon protein